MAGGDGPRLQQCCAAVARCCGRGRWAVVGRHGGGGARVRKGLDLAGAVGGAGIGHAGLRQRRLDAAVIALALNAEGVFTQHEHTATEVHALAERIHARNFHEVPAARAAGDRGAAGVVAEVTSRCVGRDQEGSD